MGLWLCEVWCHLYHHPHYFNFFIILYLAFLIFQLLALCLMSIKAQIIFELHWSKILEEVKNVRTLLLLCQLNSYFPLSHGLQMGILSRMYPCKDCADHFKEVLRYLLIHPSPQSLTFSMDKSVPPFGFLFDIKTQKLES